jgi:oligosaccharide:H+ symporter
MSLVARIQAYFSTPKGRVIGLWWTYFIYWGALAPFVPYVSLYYESIGLTGTQIGQMSAVRSIISFISAILLAFLSDTLRKRKRILLLCIFGMIFAMFLFPRMMSFVTLLPIVALYSVFQAPSIAIIDENTLRALENPRDYSKVRVGGSFGWGILIFFAGLLIDRPGVPLNIIFTLHILLILPLIILLILQPESQPTPDPEGKKASFNDVLDLLRYPGFALWMGVIFLFGASEASLINFLFLHVRDIGGSNTLMGITMTFAILGEIIGFNIAKRLQGRVGSRQMIVIAIAIRTLWFLLIALNKVPLLVLPIQILGGGSFSLIEAGSVAYVNERTPRRIGTTAQGIRSAIFLRLSSVIGSLVAGALYQNSGSGVMYGVMAAFSSITLILAFFLRRTERRREALKSSPRPS